MVSLWRWPVKERESEDLLIISLSPNSHTHHLRVLPLLLFPISLIEEISRLNTESVSAALHILFLLETGTPSTCYCSGIDSSWDLVVDQIDRSEPGVTCGLVLRVMDVFIHFPSTFVGTGLTLHSLSVHMYPERSLSEPKDGKGRVTRNSVPKRESRVEFDCDRSCRSKNKCSH